ncbi:MAG: SH3 domain-containing protein [Clostridia bacterium]|nr:SH3 domain-containing protein [Clostridia bacterium]
MKRKILSKVICTLILVAILLIIMSIKSNASSLGISTSKSSVSPGEAFTATVSVGGGAGRVSASVSNGTGGKTEFVDNSSFSFTCTAGSSGSVTIRASGTIADYSTETDENKNASKTVTIVQPSYSTPSTPSSSSNSSTSKSTPTKTNASTARSETSNVTFTSVNQTVYAIGKVNVRSSYSSSSSKLGTLQKDDSVTRIGVGSNGWSKINYNGRTAYVSTDYLTTKKVDEIKAEEQLTGEEEEILEKSSVSYLGSLNVKDFQLDKEFNKDITEYTVMIGKNVENLEIEALPESDKATVRIEGNENFKDGENIIQIIVTAEDGTTTTYIISALKEFDTLGLLKLDIKGLELEPYFSTDIFEYRVQITDRKLTKLDIEAIASNEDAEIEIIGNEELANGENIITINVKLGDEVVTYKIIANKTTGFNIIYVSYACFALAGGLIIFLIVYIKKHPKISKH